MRLLITSFAVLLGVAFMAGTLVFTDTIARSFDGLFAEANEGTDSYVRAEYRFAFPNLVALLAPVLTVSVNAVLTANGRISVESAFTVWTIAQLLAALLLGWYVLRRLEGFGRPDVRLASRMLGFGVKAHT